MNGINTIVDNLWAENIAQLRGERSLNKQPIKHTESAPGNPQDGEPDLTFHIFFVFVILFILPMRWGII